VLCLACAAAAPAMPPVFEPTFLQYQFEAWTRHCQRCRVMDAFEVSVMQPTFMIGMRLAKEGYDTLAVNAAKKQLTTFPISNWQAPVHMQHAALAFVGATPTIGTMKPDFGVFLPGHAATSFSALLIGDTDGKASVVAGKLSNEHKGKQLGYQQQVLNDCPRRVWQSRPIYSFLTNLRTVQFMRTTRRGNAQDEEEASMEVGMRIGWPALWQLVNGSAAQLGGSLPSVSVEGQYVRLQKELGMGAQGVCFAAELDASDTTTVVVVKISSDLRQLRQERRVLGALHPEGEVRTATCRAENGEELHDDPEAVEFCDGKYALPESARQSLPILVAYGPGMLVLRKIGKSFDQGSRFPCCAGASIPV
jgi:hypothetical protein